MQYYKKIDSCVGVDNPEVVPLLFHMRWFGCSIPEKMHLRVHHPEDDSRRAHMCDSAFHKVLCMDIDESATSPFRKATLRLEGKYCGKSLYAILECNLSSRFDTGNSIILSPLPFGLDGKPKIPYSGDDRLRFLVNLWHFLTHEPVWTVETYSKVVMSSLPGIAASKSVLEEFLKLGFASSRDNKHFEFNITPADVEMIFGVEFPK